MMSERDARRPPMDVKQNLQSEEDPCSVGLWEALSIAAVECFVAVVELLTIKFRFFFYHLTLVWAFG